MSCCGDCLLCDNASRGGGVRSREKIAFLSGYAPFDLVRRDIGGGKSPRLIAPAFEIIRVRKVNDVHAVPNVS